MAKKENPNAFKHWISPGLVKKISREIKRAYPAFDERAFAAVSRRLKPLELKDRVRAVAEALRDHLPEEYPRALGILERTARAEALDGFDLWPFTHFVQTYGLGHFEESMRALRLLTQKFTAEFAVRPFLLENPGRTLALLEEWAADENHHVRRWVSEGTRPRLPWGERLGFLILDPRPTLPLLEKLKYDPEAYVRKSVANHLNDIAKDHPELVVKVLEKWRKERPEAHAAKIDWITRHALRTLIKKGHAGALALIGVGGEAKVRVGALRLNKASYRLGEPLEFEFALHSTGESRQKLVVDYVIHHVKANRERAPKVFKLKTFEIGPGEKRVLRKKHLLRPISTRTYYPGEHLLEIQVNGRILAKRAWRLVL